MANFSTNARNKRKRVQDSSQFTPTSHLPFFFFEHTIEIAEYGFTLAKPRTLIFYLYFQTISYKADSNSYNIK